MANNNQQHLDNNTSQDDNTDADAFAILSLLFIAYAAVVYYLSH